MDPSSYSYNPGDPRQQNSEIEAGRLSTPDFLHGYEGDPEDLNSIDRLIGLGVDLQFREMEENYLGDPFRNLQRASSNFERRMGREGSILDQMGARLARSSSTIQQTYEQRSLAQGSRDLRTGLISQPSVDFYRDRFSQPGARIQGSIFQLQQSGVVSSLLRGGGTGSIITQVFEQNIGESSEEARRKAQILAGNQVSISASAAQGSGVEIKGVRAMGSFHAKVGFIELTGGPSYAFIGTQNITPAIERGSSFNPVLSLRTYSYQELTNLTENKQAAARFEDRLARQVGTLSTTIGTSVSKLGEGYYRPGTIRDALTQRGVTPNIVVESDILSRLNATLEGVKNQSNLNVVISSAEIGLLLNSQSTDPRVAQLRQTALDLAQRGQLDVITGSKTIDRILGSGANESLDNQGMQLVDALLRRGAVRLANTGYLHDKTVAVIDRSKQELRFLTMGSANLSGYALESISSHLSSQDEVVSAGVSAAFGVGGLKGSALSQTFNFEANVAIGGLSDDWRLKNRDESAYLGSIQGQFFKTYSSLGQQDLITGKSTGRQGFLAETFASSSKVEMLRTKLLSLAQKEGFGDLIEINSRYNLAAGAGRDGRLQGIEVKINSKGGVGMHAAQFFLTVHDDGSVIFSDRKKVVTGSLYVNKSQSERTIAGIKVASGQSISLSGIDTAVGLVGTMAYALESQSALGLPKEFFTEQLVSGSLNQGAQRFLSSMLDLGAGAVIGSDGVGLNNTSRLESLARGIQQQPHLLQQLRGILGQRAADLAEVSFRGTSPLAALNPEQRVERAMAIAQVFDTFTSDRHASAQQRIEQTTLALNRVLANDTSDALADLKAAYVMSDPILRAKAEQMAKRESKEFTSLLLSPYLEPHSLQYSAAQATYRRPVYGVTDESIPDGLDVLNPITVRAGVKVGQPGEFIQLIGSSGYVAGTKGEAGLSVMKLVKEDLASGAVTLYDTKGIFQSTNSLGYSTPEERRQRRRARIVEARRFLQSRNLYSPQQIQSYMQAIGGEDVGTEDEVYVPFSAKKLEQVQQRLKNTLGARSSIVGSNEAYQRIAEMDPTFTGEVVRQQIHAGELRATLPMQQFERVQELSRQYGGDYNKVLEHLRREELNPFNTQRGFLTTAGLKRVAMNIGPNFMGDFSYLNPGYEETMVETSVSSLKFSTKGIDDVQAFTEMLAGKMSGGARIIGRPVEVSRDYISDLLTLKEDGSIDKTASAQALREAKSRDRSYERFILQTDPTGQTKVYLREGLYGVTQKTIEGRVHEQYERIGDITSEGRIVLGHGTKFNVTGEFVDPITNKFTAFTKRYLDGITIMPGLPHIDANLQRGTVTIQSEAITASKPKGGLRLTGPALDKGAAVYLKENIFETLDKEVSGIHQRRSTGQTPQASTDERAKRSRLFGLFSFNTVKGYSFGTGIHYINTPEYRSVLDSADATARARAAALIFMGQNPNSDVKSALVKNYRSRGEHILAAQALLSSTQDYSSSALGRHASGLNLLASPEFLQGDEGGNQMVSVKKTIVAALSGNIQALEHIDSAFTHMFNLVGSTDERNLPAGKQILTDQATGKKHVIVSDNDPLIRSAAFMADALFTSQALAGARANAVSGLGSMRFYDSDKAQQGQYITRYLTDNEFKTKVDTIGMLAGKDRLPEPGETSNGMRRKAVKRRLAELQGLMDAQVVVERVVDTHFSSSLTAYGSKDNVSMEYHLTAGASAAWLNRLKPYLGSGEQAATIQQAYGRLLQLSRPGSVKDSGMLVRYMLPLDESITGAATLGIKEGYNVQMTRLNIENRERLHQMSHLGLFESDVTQARVHEAIRGGSGKSIQARAMDLAQVSEKRFKFIASGDYAERQLSLLREGVGNEIKGVNSTHLVEGIADLYAGEMVRFGQKLADFSSDQASLMSFGEFLQHHRSGGTVSKLEGRYGYFEDIAGAKGIKGLSAGTLRRAGEGDQTAIERVKARSRQHLLRMNEKSIANLEQDLARTEGQRYLTAMADLNQISSASDPTLGGKAKAIVDEVGRSRHIIVPAFNVRKDRDGFRVQYILDAAQQAPTSGVLLGSDVLTHSAVSFPGFDSQILTNQMRMERVLAGSHDIMVKTIRGESISQEELNVLYSLHEAVHSTKDAPLQLLETETTRRAFGDRQKFQGVSAGAVDSLALGFNEVVLGQRAQVLHDRNPVKQVLDRQIEMVEMEMVGKIASAEGSAQHASVLLSGSKALDQLQVLVGNGSESNRNVLREAAHSYLIDVGKTFYGSAEGDMIGGMAMRNQEMMDGNSPEAAELGRRQKHFRNQIYGLAVGLKPEDVQRMSPTELMQSLNFQEGVSNRGGSPTGNTLTTQEYNVSRVRTQSTYNRKLEREKMAFQLDSAKNQMVAMMPTLSWMMPMLGDFDGDSYIFVAGTRGEAMTQLNSLDRRIEKETQRIDQLERAFASIQEDDLASTAGGRDSARYRVGEPILKQRQEEIQARRAELQELHKSRDEFFVRFNDQYNGDRRDSSEVAQLSSLKRWAGSYMLMPEWMEDYASTGETFGSVEQTRALFAGVHDHADLIRESDLSARKMSGAIHTMGGLPAAGMEEGAAQDAWNRHATLQAQYASPTDLAHDLMLANALQEREGTTFSASKLPKLQAELQGSLYRNVTVYSAGLDSINKQFGKVAGIVSTVSQFDQVQGVMQQAGALLGVAYNSLVPMIDQAIFQNSFGMIASQGGEAFRVDLLKAAGSVEGGQALIDRMGLNSESEFKNYIGTLQEGVSNTTTFMAGMQQAVRDALKQKGEGGLSGAIERFELSSKLSKIESSNITETEKDRLRGGVMKDFMSEAYRSINFGVKQDNAFADIMLPQTTRAGHIPGGDHGASLKRGFDWGVGGFGALFMLAEYQQAGTDGDLASLVESNDRWKEAYQAATERGDRISHDRFLAEQIGDLITRTQAAFIGDRIAGSEQAANSYVENARRYYNDVTSGKVVGEGQGYEITKRFFEQEASSSDVKGLRSDYIQAMSYMEAQRRQVASADRIQALRQKRRISLTATQPDAPYKDDYLQMEDQIARSQMQLAQDFRRGKLPGAAEMIGVASSELNALSTFAKNNNMATEQAAHMMFMMGADLVPGDEELGNVLSRALVHRHDPASESLLDRYGAQTAATAELLSIQTEKGRLASELLARDETGGHVLMGDERNIAARHFDHLNEQYNQVYQNYKGLSSGSSPATYNPGTSSNLLEDLENFTREAAARVKDRDAQRNQGRQRLRVIGDSRLEIIGALAAPALFALAGGGEIKLDERSARLGFDLIQAVPDVARTGLFGQIAGVESEAQVAAAKFRRARITDQVREQGLAGIGTGIAQELLMVGASSLGQQLVRGVLGKTPEGDIRGGTAIARVGAELISTAIGMGLSRRISERMTRRDVADTSSGALDLADTIAQGVQRITAATQQAIAGIMSDDDDLEARDGDSFQQVDFVASLPTELELDIETGMVVIDENDNVIAGEFDNSNSSFEGSSTFRSQSRKQNRSLLTAS